ncbi:hypothetical protein P6144_13685 [Sphingomonas sp. HITSZ_GF]|uniref:hypothetical protein n=1 Tax=Sphingomonas sp. HITSZ_GF TaxID=3037247 RepID=UPI00240E82BA|nr:hypothetical protein [Sphingomonas sp. HITSZ_GF]MDG2534708.1 hypothetical protein [Sphingomonas sp. HITSZ_GF]
MRALVHGIGAAMALLMASPAIAQDHADPDPQSTIVVRGKTLSPREQARKLVGRMSAPVQGQLARFGDEVCPYVVGFTEAYAAKVDARIRKIAAEAGAEPGGSDCRPNLVVVVVDNGRDFTRELYRLYPGQFFGMEPSDRKRLLDSQATARSWTVTGIHNEDGRAVGSSASRESETSMNQSRISIGNGTPVLVIPQASIINPSTQQQIELAYVVIETRATLGKRLMQVADYAAMRGMMRTRPEKLAADDDTILRLFEPGATDGPATLTPSDRAYLSGLYYGRGNRSAASQMGQITKTVAKSAGEPAKP